MKDIMVSHSRNFLNLYSLQHFFLYFEYKLSLMSKEKQTADNNGAELSYLSGCVSKTDTFSIKIDIPEP